MKNLFYILILITSISCKDFNEQANNWAKQNSLRKPQANDTVSNTKISTVCPRGSTLDAKLSTEDKKMCRTNSGTIFPAADAFQEYYMNGNPKTLLVHSGDNLLRVNWYENGRQKEEIQYRNNHKEGIFRSWYSNGKLQETGNYLLGKKNGIFKIFYEEGNIKEKANYRNGLREGLTENYNANGKLISRETFQANIKHGNAEYLSPETGKISSHGTFENGFYSGRWIFYNKNGTRSAFGSYDKEGKKHGDWKYFNEKGFSQNSEYYANGELSKKLELRANVPFNNSDQIGAKPPELRPQNRYKPNTQITPITTEKKGWQPM